MGRSLRVRLLAGAAGAIAAALALAWLAMGYLFEAHVQRSVEATLIQHGRQVVADLSASPAGEPLIAPALSDPRFDRPASGLYWQVTTGDRTLRSRSLWDQVLTLNGGASAAEWTTGDLAGPFDQKLVYAARRVTLSGSQAPILVVMGADHADVTAARADFSRQLLLFLLLLWVVLSAAAWGQVQLGLKPLQDVREALRVMRVRPGARLQQGDYPTEIAPLTEAVNALAQAREHDLAQARRRAADLAHSLKTPLSALAAQGRRAREAGATDAADGLDRAIDAARSAVERELARSLVAAEQDAARAKASPVIDRLIAVVERTEGGARLDFDNALGDVVLPVSEAVLMELAGPLLENAARFARLHVRVGGDDSRLVVEDDGPGLDESEVLAVLERGKRLDEAGGGHGLGLAIVRELAELSGAALALGRSPLGGLRAELRWP